MTDDVLYYYEVTLKYGDDPEYIEWRSTQSASHAEGALRRAVAQGFYRFNKLPDDITTADIRRIA